MDNAELRRAIARFEHARMNRRRLLKLGAAGLGLSAIPLLSACGGGSEEAPATSSSGSSSGATSSGSGSASTATQASGGSTGQTTVVKFEGWDYEPPLVEQNINRFKELNPNIDVQYTPINSAQYRTKIVAEFTAGAEPDALYVRDDYFAGWVTAGYLQPIEGMPGLDEAYDKMYQFNADAMTYEGQRYGLPYYTDCNAFVYNAEMLEKAGISEPPKTLEEIVSQGKKLQEAGVVKYPMALGMKLSTNFWGHWWSLIYGSDAKLFDADMNPLMNSEDTVARDVLQWIKDNMTDDGVLDPAGLELDGDQIRDAFMAGQYAFCINARYDIERENDPDLSQIAGKAKMALMPSLTGETHGTVGWTRCYGLSKNTDVKDEAYKLIYYLGGLDETGEPYTAKFWFLERGLGFAYQPLTSDPEIQEKLSKFVDPEIYGLQAEMARARENINEPWYSEWESANQELMQKCIIDQATVDDVMKGMADNTERFKQLYA